MDYSKIVLEGYCDENNREFLEQYFLREFKKAGKEHFFGANEFFSGCLKVTKGWQNELKQIIHKYKTLLYSELNNAETPETIKYYEQELKNIRPDEIDSYTVTMPLRSLTTGCTYQIGFNEINQINLAITKAYVKATDVDSSAPKDAPATLKQQMQAFLASIKDYTDVPPSQMERILRNRGVDGYRETWKGKPADAYRFMKWAGLSVKEFNECFTMPDGRKLAANDKARGSNAPITKILSDFTSLRDNLAKQIEKV